ncbi:MAG TPA: hypothetical protein VGY13_02145 [Solirubrobacteraceae bacterium]|nr:hypothetical protein [Solirubrobacteraceae bacterium]
MSERASAVRDRLAPWAPWLVAGSLAAWCFVTMVVAARVDVLGRFDDGIEYTTVTYLLHGQLPYTDFYEPYGIGLGIPGVLPHLLSFDGVFAIRLAYGLFPALVTLLVTVFVWRRRGPAAAVLVGLVSITSTTPRYSMGFAALFGFAVLVDRLVRRTASGTLREAADRHPRALLAASALCSLAGWARTEYALFAAFWAVVLLFALAPGRRRQQLVAGTLLLAALPSLIVLVTGGLEHLWWFVSYTISSSPSGFHAQRGQPIEWHLVKERLDEILHLQLGPSTAGSVIASYGVGLVAVLGGLATLAVPRWRRRLLAGDPSQLTPLMIFVCVLVLYGQAARFSVDYGDIGNPIFWVTGALLLPRASRATLVAVTAFVAYALLPGIAPGTVYDMWKARPPTGDRVVVPGFNRIPIAEDGGAPSMAALVAQWRSLGLDGRATVDVELRNDVAWGNDAIVGYLLNAPPAAWPLSYDPGLVNTAKVERESVSELCHDRAPVVQNNTDYPYPAGKPEYVGSRLLDEFLAIDYRVRAVAGFYRILLPSTPHCELPAQFDDQALERAAEQLVAEGEMAEAGALGILLLERAQAHGESASPAAAALAALGGYSLTPAQLPSGPLGVALRALGGSPSATSLAAAAAQPWPSDLERLAAQTAWVAHRAPGEAGTAQASQAIFALAQRHPDWPTAIANLSAVEPPSPALLASLERAGARGMPEFDRWRRGYFLSVDEPSKAIAAGLALVADYQRRDDPVDAGQVEVEVAQYVGVSPGCAFALRQRAGQRPGMRVPQAASGPACTQPQLVAAGY